MRITAKLYDDYTDEDKELAKFVIKRYGYELVDGTTKNFLVDIKGSPIHNAIYELKHSGVFRTVE